MTAKHRPSDESRKIVERAIGAGFTQPQVARLLGISDRSVRKHYKKELATGVLTATHQVAAKLYDLCMSGDRAAIILWLRCRAGVG